MEICRVDRNPHGYWGLKGVRMNINQCLKEKRDAIFRIAAEHGACKVRVFGSVAGGEARLDSEVDLLVELGPGGSLLDQAALLLKEVLGDVACEALKNRGDGH